MTDDEMVAVIFAHKDGKQIQYRTIHGNGHWYSCTDNKPLWDFTVSVYRVKPEPRECWVNITANGFRGYSSESAAYERTNPDTKYDGIAIHMREVEKEDE